MFAGGGIEPGEDVLTALNREIIEETGIAPEIGNLLYIHQLGEVSDYGGPDFFFHIRNGADYVAIDLSKTTHGELELAEIAFVDIASCSVLPAFLKMELPDLAVSGFKAPTRIKIEPFAIL